MRVLPATSARGPRKLSSRLDCKQAFNFDQRTERDGPSNERLATSIGVQCARPFTVHHRRRAETTVTDLPASFHFIASALREAERPQTEFDGGAEAIQAYVIDAAGIPVRRVGGGA